MPPDANKMPPDANKMPPDANKMPPDTKFGLNRSESSNF
jgi:hypothetical protein